VNFFRESSDFCREACGSTGSILQRLKTTMLNMIRLPDRDPTRFCNSEPDWTGFVKRLTGSDMDNQTALITAVKCKFGVFFWYKLDWIKYLDRSTGLGSDRITQWKFWTGSGLEKSPLCSTLQNKYKFTTLVKSTVVMQYQCVYYCMTSKHCWGWNNFLPLE